jgi:hypothetical protein
MELHRRLGNLAFVMLVRLLFGGRFTDLCYGYNAFWKRVLPLLELDSDGFEIETLMNVRALHAGLLVTEVPSFESRRKFGISNLRTFRDGYRVLKTIFYEWLSKPELRAIKLTEARKMDDFVPAIRLLCHEAVQLAHNRSQLSQSAYKRALEALSAGYEELLEMKFSSPTSARLQARYRRYYSGKDLWQFLEKPDVDFTVLTPEVDLASIGVT